MYRAGPANPPVLQAITQQTEFRRQVNPGQSKFRKHNESVIGEEIGSQDLLIATPELLYNKMGDQHLLHGTGPL